MNNTSGMCQANLGSVTYAMKAQKLLHAAAIPANITKNEGAHGCSYALNFSCAQLNNVKTVFANEGIRVKQWNTQS